MAGERRTQGYRAHLLPLEPRMMFDAAAISLVAEAAGADAGHAPIVDHGGYHPAAAERPAEHDTGARHTFDQREPAIADPAPPARDVIFIDTAVADYRQLAAEWAGRGEVVLIDATRDGIDQMRAALAGRHDIGAIHIVSHGSSGVLQLGTTRLDQGAIEGSLAGSLAAIGRSLGADGDILIYGCDFAAGSAGARALAAFADVTGADVAASTDTTGYAARGGDWDLESRTGMVEARSLDSRDWAHTLDPNTPVPISVTANSLTVRDANRNVNVSGTTGFDAENRSPDVGLGATATWVGAATFQGKSVDLRATVVAISDGDAVRFTRPTGTGPNADDPTFLLRDLTAANDATVSIKWELIDHDTGLPLPADVRFTIADIDGIDGNANSRETVTASTENLAYYTRERVSDIAFAPTLSAVTASGTQNENTVAGEPITSKSAATFDWTQVSAFTLTYKLTTNAVTTQAQFFHDGDADFIYTDPVYVSIPTLDLDGNDSTAGGTAALTTFTEDGARVGIVDADVVVGNPMPSEGIVGATVRLTNWKSGDNFQVGTLPAGLSASIGAVVGGTQTVTISGTGSAADYAAAFRAITFANSSNTPDTTQRVIEVTFSNDTLTSATALSRINVVAANDAPIRVGTLPSRSTSDAASVTYPTAGGFSDPDGDTLNYAATGLPAGLTINQATGVVSGTIDRSASQANGGVYTVVVTARDPSNAAQTQSFTITVANPGPDAVNDPTTTLAEDTSVTIAVLANDTDPDGDPLTVTAASALHGSVVRNANGTLTYTPDTNYNGPDTITYTISDGQGGTDTATAAITVTPVNDAPVRVGTLPPRTTSDGASVNYATAGGFSDPERDTLSYSATGLPTGLAIDPTTGAITGTLDRSASQVNGGVYDVVVTARDPSNAAQTQSFIITVANPGPDAVDDPTTTLAEDTSVTIAVLGNDVDPDGDPLTVTAASALHGTVVRNADGTLTYTPNANYNGPDTITYTISDGQGGTDTATAAITVTPVDDAPRAIAIPPDYRTSDGAAVIVNVAPIFDDPDGDTLRYAASGLPAGLSIDADTGRITGTVDRSASQVGGGVYTVVLTATAPDGASATQSVRLLVTNPPPVATDDPAATTAEETPVTIAVLGNDSDPDGDPLTVVAASALHGSVAINPDGTLTYTPAVDYFGTDTITYRISDGQGGTAEARVQVNVTPVDDAPVAVGTLPARGTIDGNAVSIPTAGGFADADGDTLRYTATGLPAGLTIDPVTGVITGTLDRSASQVNGGTYTVVVTASDSAGASATQSFTLAAHNPGPSAVDDRANTRPGSPIDIAVLANDSDPDGDPLTVTAASAANGSVTIRPDGSIRYTPNAGFTGTDRIDYAIADGQGGTATATVLVDVTNAPPAAAASQSVSGSDGQSVSIPIGNQFADPDGDPLRFTATGLPPGLAIDPATGTIRGTIDRAGSQANGGRYTAVVTADDGRGSRSSTTLTWTIDNPPPVARDDAITTAENTPVTIPVLANDSDPDADPLTIVAASAGRGTVTIGPDGTLRYVPAPDFSGTDTISYTIGDGNGGTASATVAVTVTAVNDAPTPLGLPDRIKADGAAITMPLAGGFADRDGDALRYTATGLPPGLTLDPATGIASGTIVPGSGLGGPNGDGRYPVTVTATDPAGAQTSSTFTFVVSAGAPTPGNDTATTPADTPVAIPVLANDTDPEGEPLTLVSATATNGVVSIVGGQLTYTPAAGYVGPATIVYVVSDPAGNRATATVLVDVTPVDRAPVGQAIPTQTARDGQAVALELAPFYRDPDGDPLRYTATGLPPGLSIDPATGRISGTIDRSASAVGDGVFAVTVTADDGVRSASTSFDWRVANSRPIARDDVVEGVTDAPVGIAVFANDTDPDGDPLRVIDAVAGRGTVTIGADGRLTYTPGPGFTGSDTIVYTIDDGNGGQATAYVTVTARPNALPVLPAQDAAVIAYGGRPITIDALREAIDPDGDPLTIIGATTANGAVTINPDGTLGFTPALGFVGTTTIRYRVTDGRGGVADGTIVVTVRDPATADVEQLLRIGRVTFVDPTPALAVVRVTDGAIRNPMALLDTVESLRDLRSTRIGDRPVGDAVEGVRSLRGTTIDPTAPIAAEVARLERLADRRDAGDRLFDQRWSDFFVKGLTGFSVAADRDAGVMVESVVRDGAIYLEVRDIATDHRAAIRSVAIRTADGGTAPDWIRVDPRGLAIIERPADADEIHLIVRVTRENGRVTATPIVIQGATGEVELDRKPVAGAHRAATVDPATLSPRDARQAIAARLAASFE